METIEQNATVKPQKMEDEPLKCFLFDARFDHDRGGVACFVKVMSGVFDHNTVRQLYSYHNKRRYEIY